MTQEIVLRRTRRRLRPGSVIVPVLILCLAWSTLWMLARRQALRLADGWFAAEAAQGRTWSCPGRAISGFPFGFTLSCIQPVFTTRIGGDLVQGQLAGLAADAAVLHPSTLRIALTSPLTLHRSDGSSLADVSWSRLAIDLGMTLEAALRAGLTVDQLEVATPDQQPVHIGQGELRVVQAGTSPGGRTYDVAIRVGGAEIPVLDEAVGQTAKLDLGADAAVTSLDIRGVEAWPTIVERWRQAGGRVGLTMLRADTDALHLQAQGALGLDEQHRLSGLLQSRISGYEPLARRFGLPVGAVSLGGALAGLLNGAGHVPAPPPEPDRASIALPVTFNDGRLLVGPFKTALRLAPLY